MFGFISSFSEAELERPGKLWAEHGHPLSIIGISVFVGWYLLEKGQVEEGLAAIHQGLAICEAAAVRTGIPTYRIVLAQCYARIGQPEVGIAGLDQELAAIDAHGHRFFEAELHRLKGELLLPSDEQAAEGFFQQALTIAREQIAKSWELRAAMSLARLWQQRGKRAVYGWFTEGFETPDLKDAKALLTELEQQAQ